MITRLLLSLSLVTLSFSIQAIELIADIPKERLSLQYSQPARLTQVLNDIQSKRTGDINTFPIASQLFDNRKQKEVQALQNSVLTRLQLIKTTTDYPVEQLIADIKQWNTGYRIKTSLDYDAIRIDSELDPLLSGHFEFTFPQRSHKVELIGLITRPTQVSITDYSSIAALMRDIVPLPDADPSFVWVVHPDGYAERVGYAYWNNAATRLTSNSTIYVGFDSDSDQLASLEKDIIKLISMRKVL